MSHVPATASTCKGADEDIAAQNIVNSRTNVGVAPSRVIWPSRVTAIAITKGPHQRATIRSGLRTTLAPNHVAISIPQDASAGNIVAPLETSPTVPNIKVASRTSRKTPRPFSLISHRVEVGRLVCFAFNVAAAFGVSLEIRSTGVAGPSSEGVEGRG
jgi:hypothetical protein